jgi:hypothetical protein
LDDEVAKLNQVLGRKDGEIAEHLDNIAVLKNKVMIKLFTVMDLIV